MEYKAFKKQCAEIASEFGVDPICVQRVWYSMFDFIYQTVDKLPSFKTITEEEFDGHITNFLIPGAFRIKVDFERIQKLNKHKAIKRQKELEYFGEEEFNRQQQERENAPRNRKANLKILNYGQKKK